MSKFELTRRKNCPMCQARMSDEFHDAYVLSCRKHGIMDDVLVFRHTDEGRIAALNAARDIVLKKDFVKGNFLEIREFVDGRITKILIDNDRVMHWRDEAGLPCWE